MDIMDMVEWIIIMVMGKDFIEHSYYGSNILFKPNYINLEKK